METFIRPLADLFGGTIIYIVIFGLGIWTFAGLITVFGKLKALSDKMNNNAKGSRGVALAENGEGYKQAPVVYDWENIKLSWDEYNEIHGKYSIYEQFIPVFPLLGILGTVSGLIMQLDDISRMREALSVSMYTTFLGLVFAIFLRLLDAWTAGRLINKMELDFETAAQNYQIAMEKGRIKGQNI